MRILVAASLAGLVGLGIASQATADPADATMARQVIHLQQRVHHLEQRRTYLHHFIHRLRAARAAHVTTAYTNSPSKTQNTGSSYPSGVLSSAEVASFARGAGFPESAVPTMVAYAYRESHFDPRAINSSSGACGLWQLYPCYGGSSWLDPATNAHFAYLKYRASGFAPWGG